MCGRWFSLKRVLSAASPPLRPNNRAKGSRAVDSEAVRTSCVPRARQSA